MMATLKSFSENLIQTSLSFWCWHLLITFFFHSAWALPGSWYDEGFLMESWTFCVLFFETLNLKLPVLSGLLTLFSQRKGVVTFAAIWGRNPGCSQWSWKSTLSAWSPLTLQSGTVPPAGPSLRPSQWGGYGDLCQHAKGRKPTSTISICC